jgi:filamentous hemagglutinin family protein
VKFRAIRVAGPQTPHPFHPSSSILHPLCLLTCFVLSAGANPVGPTVTQGTASFATQGSHFTVQTSDRAYINWQSFNIGLGETTSFLQPSTSSLVWNYINDSNPSQILGSLNANGYVVLQNPSGFYIGGQAAITTHGLLMTTAPILMPDLSGGGSWTFNTPPPTAKIINYGQIAVGNGGSAFLIAHDVENNGTITSPRGDIGLYAGKQVLISERPDGRGLSAQVTLPEGSVDNSGKLVADAGTIGMHAQVVNQGGLVQANSVREVNGVIELVASDRLNLTASSVVSAKGDSQGTSAGGTVTIKSGNSFSDQTGSLIDVSGGPNGGNGGKVEISAANLGPTRSRIEGHAASGFLGGSLTLDPVNVTLDNAYASSLDSQISGGLSSITIQADNNIEVSTLWNPADQNQAATLTFTAGNNITFDNNSGIAAGKNWSVNMSAGPQNLSAQPASGSDGIYLNGNSFLQTQNGNINLWAANEIIVNSGAVRTVGGGNIGVTTKFGNVDAGINPNGYDFITERNSNPNHAPPYYSVDPNLGGISTAAGGNVTITAGGNVASYLPTQSDYDGNLSRSDAGTGAFGSQPGNVTITAGGDVSGHYLVANGAGKITAAGNIGAPVTKAGGFDLSLIKGSWGVYAPNGYIYLREVRNPNGIFNDTGNATSYASYHFFDYDPEASVVLDAGNFVEITGGGPRPSDAAVPVIFPPTLQVIAGPGGFRLDTDVILYPSPFGNLDITTLGGGSFQGNNNFLEMSDSGSQQWNGTPVDGKTGSFLYGDRAPSPGELNNPTPVTVSISGDMNNATLYTTKQTQINVAGDMNNSSFVGENLHASDQTSINVAGKIYNTPSLNFVNLTTAITSANALQPNTWDSVFELAVDPSVASLNALTFSSVSALKQDLRSAYLLFPQIQSRYGLGANPGFIYDASTLRLGFNGNLSSVLSPKQLSALEGGTFTVLVIDANGNPVIEPNGQLETKTYTFVPASAAGNPIQNLYAASLAVPQTPASGFQMGGPGQFNITAASIELGNSPGILSWGIGNGSQVLGGVNYSSLTPFTPSGASVNVDVSGELSLLTSRVASLYGGNVTVNSTGGGIDLGSQDFFITATTTLAYGIYTSGHSDVSVSAFDNVNISGSRIAAYNGGNVLVESSHGNVDAGVGGNNYVYVPLVSKDPTTGNAVSVSDPIYGSGIVAVSLPSSLQASGGISLPGNITVQTPRGDITSSKAGILQLDLGGNVAGGPTVTLTAGTPALNGSPAVPGNVELGDSGLIGGTVNVTAQGNIQGLIISRQNSAINAAQSFSGAVLSAGTASLAAGGSVSGTVIGVGGASVSGGGAITATVLSQNASVNGGAAQSTLGTAAAATSTSQAAAQSSTSDTKEQVALADNSQNDDGKKKKATSPGLMRRVGRVTVILPPNS